MVLVGRRRERREIEDLLERAGRGSGGVLAIVGPAGSGKTALADEAADTARERGFEVLRASPARTQPGPMELDGAARQLPSGVRTLTTVIDDVDHGGQRGLGSYPRGPVAGGGAHGEVPRLGVKGAARRLRRSRRPIDLTLTIGARGRRDP